MATPCLARLFWDTKSERAPRQK